MDHHRLTVFPAVLVLAGTLLSPACSGRTDREAAAGDGSESTELPSAATAPAEIDGERSAEPASTAIAPGRRVGLEIRPLDGSSRPWQAEVEEGGVVSLRDETGGLGLRPEVIRVEGVDGDAVRIDLLDLPDPAADPTATPPLARLIVRPGGSGTIEAPDGEGTFEVRVTAITQPSEPASQG